MHISRYIEMFLMVSADGIGERTVLGVVTQRSGSVSACLVVIGGCLVLCGILATGARRYRQP